MRRYLIVFTRMYARCGTLNCEFEHVWRQQTRDPHAAFPADGSCARRVVVIHGCGYLGMNPGGAAKKAGARIASPEFGNLLQLPAEMGIIFHPHWTKAESLEFAQRLGESLEPNGVSLVFVREFHGKSKPVLDLAKASVASEPDAEAFAAAFDRAWDHFLVDIKGKIEEIKRLKRAIAHVLLPVQLSRFASADAPGWQAEAREEFQAKYRDELKRLLKSLAKAEALAGIEEWLRQKLRTEGLPLDPGSVPPEWLASANGFRCATVEGIRDWCAKLCQCIYAVSMEAASLDAKDP